MNSPQQPSKSVDHELNILNVGTRLQLESQRTGSSDAHFTILLGFSKGDFLIVKCPVVRNVPFIYYDAELVLVRAFTGTTIFTFHSLVTRTLLSPMYYMHLAFPDLVTKSSLRSALRIKVDLKGTVVFQDLAGHQQSAQVQLLNLSLTGAALVIGKALSVGQNVEAAFNIDDEGKEIPITVDGIVRSQIRRPLIEGRSADFFTCGIEFLDLSEGHQNALKIFAYGRAIQDRRNIA